MENKGHQGREHTREGMVDNQEEGDKERDVTSCEHCDEKLSPRQQRPECSPICATKQRHSPSSRYGSSYSSQGGNERRNPATRGGDHHHLPFHLLILQALMLVHQNLNPARRDIDVHI